jgi:hypothetical protein
MALIANINFTIVQHHDKGSKVMSFTAGQKLTDSQAKKLTARQIKDYTTEARKRSA